MNNKEKIKIVEASLDGVEKRFFEASRKYATTTRYLSFINVNYPEYQELLSMGNSIVPYLLKDLEKEKFGPGVIGDFNPWAHMSLLCEITGARPWKKGDEGRLKLLQDSWICWGREKGILKYEEVVLGRHTKTTRLYLGCCKVLQAIRSLYRAAWRA